MTQILQHERPRLRSRALASYIKPNCLERKNKTIGLAAVFAWKFNRAGVWRFYARHPLSADKKSENVELLSTRISDQTVYPFCSESFQQQQYTSTMKRQVAPLLGLACLLLVQQASAGLLPLCFPNLVDLIANKFTLDK